MFYTEILVADKCFSLFCFSISALRKPITPDYWPWVMPWQTHHFSEPMRLVYRYIFPFLFNASWSEECGFEIQANAKRERIHQGLFPDLVYFHLTQIEPCFIMNLLFLFFHVWPDQVIGSSLLFVHEHSSKASVWMIDFGKTTPVHDTIKLRHNIPWTEGSREDGYLIGLTSLITSLSQAISVASCQEEDSSGEGQSITWGRWRVVVEIALWWQIKNQGDKIHWTVISFHSLEEMKEADLLFAAEETHNEPYMHIWLSHFGVWQF